MSSHTVLTAPAAAPPPQQNPPEARTLGHAPTRHAPVLPGQVWESTRTKGHRARVVVEAVQAAGARVEARVRNQATGRVSFSQVVRDGTRLAEYRLVEDPNRYQAVTRERDTLELVAATWPETWDVARRAWRHQASVYGARQDVAVRIEAVAPDQPATPET